jgi:hypothetical protein
MLRTWFLMLVSALAVPVFPALAPQVPGAQAQAQSSARTYRVWILRVNRYTHRSWWEIYTTTNDQDEAQRIVNTMEEIGYQSYWE